MQTSKEWWDHTSADPKRVDEWLAKQYVGERTAVYRLSKLRQVLDGRIPAWQDCLLKFVLIQESQHALWIEELSEGRNLELPDVTPNQAGSGRYWEKVLALETQGIEDMFAIAAHAEAMRLKRITVIAAERRIELYPIAKVFEDILVDEAGHADVFRILAGPEAMERMRGRHEEGYAALGLTD